MLETYDQATKAQRTNQNNDVNVNIITGHYRRTGHHFSVQKEGLRVWSVHGQVTLKYVGRMVNTPYCKWRDQHYTMQNRRDQYYARQIEGSPLGSVVDGRAYPVQGEQKQPTLHTLDGLHNVDKKS